MTAVEPLSDEEIAALEGALATGRAGVWIGRRFPRRLIATVRARDAEIARLERECAARWFEVTA